MAHTGSLINQKFRGRPTITEVTSSNESREIPSLATALVTALVTAVAAANVTSLMNSENTDSDPDGSDKASILSNESQVSQKKMKDY